ncbi:alanine racemase, partial [Klebsiella pneumoniae]|uniref:alanine racemase n=1 Tax=Klebsiella pneumoniae TaxID=573 RepID=UPI003B982BED
FEIAHSCNTGAKINFPEYHLDMVRVGFGLYGYNPTLHPEKIELQPIQEIETTVTNIKDLPAGKSVGYDRTYYSEEEIRVATVAIGYADGV